MKRFEYRSARFPTFLPITYTESDVVIEGTCTQISRDGMEIVVRGQRPTRNRGHVALMYEGSLVDLEVRVAHLTGERCGMEFLYRSDREATMVKRVIAAIAVGTDNSD